ncbi:alpha/beta fold hydrolase [Antrihabitans sp. YC2-6]|uniref:alpha/beta fold hydrolase n=1 Tax=Antrihabitans sp. YC2-6 TaxID=2799498 RepID=UPI0018F544D3|nr:alpha/beta hydrolase [Antrihabitans sp. YC2-6]MBJ8346186.1 alpha/beta hydrolase [Antrihabitans sp. YC2-6]
MGTDVLTVQLADGSTVGYCAYGDPRGRPVFALHGVPACGAGFAWADEPAAARNIRVLAPNRPGIGFSSPRPGGWTVAEYARSLAAFADAMDIDRFGVWGYSGGGPYALASAAVSPDRVDGVVVAAGMGQIGVWATREQFEKTDRQMLDLAVRRPWLARRIMGITGFAARVAPSRAVDSFAGELAESDREVIADLGTPADAMLMFTGAFVTGPGGVVDDYAALARPWGFDVAGITKSVEVMHGSDDTMVPLAQARSLIELLPNATLTVWPGAGHLGTIRHVGEVLDRFV